MSNVSWRPLVVGGLVAGALDLAFAFCFAGAYGKSPVFVMQTIASGWLGTAAYAGGPATATLGFASHFALALLWAALFLLAARRIPALVSRPVLAGIAFGVVVFLVMRLAVLPLSAYPRPVVFRPLSTVLDLASHTLLFGVPIAFGARRALRDHAASTVAATA